MSSEKNRANVDVVKFKSGKEYFMKERIGLKPNTEREIDLNDDRFRLLFDWANDMTNETRQLFIDIESVDERIIFRREVTDVSFWKNICIISWRHEYVKSK